MVDNPIGKIQKSWMLFSCPFQQFTTSVQYFGQLIWTINSYHVGQKIGLHYVSNGILPQVTLSDLKIVNYPVPLTIFLSLSLLALTFYINPLSDRFSSEFNFFATSWAEKCMTLKVFVKAWLSIYRVGHFFHWERWACDTGTSKSFEKIALNQL